MAESRNVREYQDPDNKLYTGNWEENNKSLPIILFIILIYLKINFVVVGMCVLWNTYFMKNNSGRYVNLRAHYNQ